jgi:hypothetical protein
VAPLLMAHVFMAEATVLATSRSKRLPCWIASWTLRYVSLGSSSFIVSGPKTLQPK